MDCSKVSLFLSEYVDDQLDPASKKLVEEHLASCENCAAELASLQAYLRTMASMEKMTAPVGFLSSIHERIERPSLFERIARWLFYPLRIKLPMELAGIVAATLLLVFAYQQTPREEKEKDVSSLSHEVRQSVVSTDNKGAPLERMEADRLGTTPRQIRLTLSLHPPKLLEDAAKLRALAAPPSAPGRAEPLERHELRQSAPQPMLSKESVPSVSATGARNEESLAPRGPTEVYGFIHGTVDSMGGAVLSVDYDKATNEPETIVLRIPAGSYSPLLERLGRAGQVKEIAEPRSAALSTADKSQMLEVHIDFIPSE